MEVEMKIRGLMMDPVTSNPIVVLKDVNGTAILPIWVGPYEAHAIALEIEKVAPARPMTHDLLQNMARGLNAEVRKVVVSELRDDKKVMLLPGQHEISFRQTGYLDGTQTYVVEPAKKLIITVKLDKDPKAQFATVTSEIKLKVTPERAAVFVDGDFAGYVKQFNGMGRGMLVSPGDHHIKIALAGYQEFNTDVKLLPKQKITVKTELVTGSITQAPPAIKQN